MKLYHGSNTAIARIDLARCKPIRISDRDSV